MKNNRLKQQIERIADESSDSLIKVIVQMDDFEDANETSYLRQTAKLLAERMAASTARSFVPPKIKSKNANSTLSRASSTRTAMGRQSLAPIQQKGRDTLKHLSSTAWYKTARASEPASAGNQKRQKAQLWLSSSMALEVTPDHLWKLRELEGVAAVYPNRVVRIPPIFKSSTLPPAVEDNKGYTWGLGRTGAMACWGAFGARGTGVKVAVLDTGVNAKHVDLKGKVSGFAEFDPDGHLLKSGVNRAFDDNGHGTHCSGTIVGGKASGRLIGMAPDAKVLCGRVLQDGRGTDAQILAGMQWAVENGADVISMSLGGVSFSNEVLDTYTRAIINANLRGIPVVVAVGNEGSQTTGAPGNDVFAFTVGATDMTDLAAGFSGGRTQLMAESRYIPADHLPLIYSKPDVSAPGVAIYSASSVRGANKWEAWNGTSMATPHVAGAMALLMGEPSTIGAIEGRERTEVVQGLLISTVKELGESGQNHRFGHGRIDILRALGYAQELGYL